jgi:hypothetical protein
MKKFKITGILVSFLLTFISVTSAVTLYTLKWPIGKDFSTDPTRIEWNRSIFSTISLLNNYLWFAIGAVCFWFMIWNGYQLIMARGDQKQMDAATKALIWCAVGLVVCILARIIVNLAVKLFA